MCVGSVAAKIHIYIYVYNRSAGGGRPMAQRVFAAAAERRRETETVSRENVRPAATVCTSSHRYPHRLSRQSPPRGGHLILLIIIRPAHSSLYIDRSVAPRFFSPHARANTFVHRDRQPRTLCNF